MIHHCSLNNKAVSIDDDYKDRVVHAVHSERSSDDIYKLTTTPPTFFQFVLIEPLFLLNHPVLSFKLNACHFRFMFSV